MASEKGVLAVWSSAPNDGFVSALAEAFAEVKVEKIEWFNDLVDEEQTDYVFLAKG